MIAVPTAAVGIGLIGFAIKQLCHYYHRPNITTIVQTEEPPRTIIPKPIRIDIPDTSLDGTRRERNVFQINFPEMELQESRTTDFERVSAYRSPDGKVSYIEHHFGYSVSINSEDPR